CAQLSASEKDEIVAELASHLEELFEEQRVSGRSESEALKRALNELGDGIGALGPDSAEAARSCLGKRVTLEDLDLASRGSPYCQAHSGSYRAPKPRGSSLMLVRSLPGRRRCAPGAVEEESNEHHAQPNSASERTLDESIYGQRERA